MKDRGIDESADFANVVLGRYTPRKGRQLTNCLWCMITEVLRRDYQTLGRGVVNIEMPTLRCSINEA